MKITKLDDYVDEIQERFPMLTKTQIKKICTYGFKMFHLYNKWGADVYIESVKDFGLYAGKWLYGKDWRIKYQVLKNAIKTRLKWKIDKKHWDGYYYMGYTEDGYQRYLAQIGSKNQRRRKIEFTNFYMFKCLDEVTFYPDFKYIFRFKWPYDCGFRIRQDKMIIRDAELYMKRNPQTKKWEPVSYE